MGFTVTWTHLDTTGYQNRTYHFLKVFLCFEPLWCLLHFFLSPPQYPAGLLPNGRPGRLSYESGRLKFSSRSPSMGLNMEFSFASSLSGDFNLLKKSIKKSFTQIELKLL